MFILPIAHEESTVRRWPVVTMGIIALNIALLVVSMFQSSADHARLEPRLAEASHYVRDRPWVKSAATPGCISPEDGLGYAPDGEQAPEPGSVEEAEDRAHMKALCAAVDKARGEGLIQKYGFVPSEMAPHTLVTHQFLHGGVLHLVFNLWFLWLCGCNLEDRWGRGTFLAFYLLGGVGAAVVHKMFAVDPSVPMIGASGAIAAAMGAFLAVLGRTQIRFFYLYAISLRVRTGTFSASAYWMLPLWLASEVFSALLWKQRDGVAHWAHIGGFVLGAGVGAAMKLSGLDAKLDAKQDDALTVLREDPALGSAAALVDQGRYPEAIEKLTELASSRPEDVDVQVELLRAATFARDVRLRQRVYARLLVMYLNQGFADAAADLYKEVRLNAMEEGIPRATAFVLGEGFARNKKSDCALFAYARVRAEGLTDELAVRAGVAEATVLRTLGRRADARKLLEECRASPFSTVEIDAVIDNQLAVLGPAAIEV